MHFSWWNQFKGFYIYTSCLYNYIANKFIIFNIKNQNIFIIPECSHTILYCRFNFFLSSLQFLCNKFNLNSGNTCYLLIQFRCICKICIRKYSNINIKKIFCTLNLKNAIKFRESGIWKAHIQGTFYFMPSIKLYRVARKKVSDFPWS